MIPNTMTFLVPSSISEELKAEMSQDRLSHKELLGCGVQVAAVILFPVELVKTVYHCVKGIFSVLAMPFTRSTLLPKYHFYTAVRDIESALGWLAAILDTDCGLSIVADAKAAKSYYDMQYASYRAARLLGIRC
jgi:hypothetical protein